MAESRFAIDVAAFGKKAIRNAKLVVRRVVLDVFSRVIKATPVGNPDLWKNSKNAPPGYVGGRARGNWQTSVMAPVDDVIDRKQMELSGPAQSESELKALAWDATGTIYMTNNLPYIEELERGHSSQAPVGMVRVTLTEFPGIVESRAKEVVNK